jgi:hypothetical protein
VRDARENEYKMGDVMLTGQKGLGKGSSIAGTVDKKYDYMISVNFD